MPGPSPYREPPPPPRYRRLYRRWIGREDGAWCALSALGLGSMTAGATTTGMLLSTSLIGGGLLVLATAAMLCTVARLGWLTVECSVEALLPANRPGACAVLSRGERWELPVASSAVHVGAGLLLRYRAGVNREVLELHVLEALAPEKR